MVILQIYSAKSATCTLLQQDLVERQQVVQDRNSERKTSAKNAQMNLVLKSF